jgi:hypothetical protein
VARDTTKKAVPIAAQTIVRANFHAQTMWGFLSPKISKTLVSGPRERNEV